MPFSTPGGEAVTRRLAEIAEKENVAYDEEGLEYVTKASGGDLREAILLLQSVAEQGTVDMNNAYEVIESVESDEVAEMLRLAEEGEFDDSVDVLDTLVIEEGYSGEELLDKVLELSEAYDDDRAAELTRKLGNVEKDMIEGNSPRIHLERLLSSLST